MLKGPASSRAFSFRAPLERRRAAAEHEPERPAEPFLKGFELDVALATETESIAWAFPPQRLPIGFYPSAAR
jgi:hypothetical protein